METKNKIESMEMINRLHLNRFPEILLKEGEEEKAKEFIKKYPAEYYAIRDKSKSSGIFKLKVAKEDVLKEIKGYKLCSINVSSINYVDNQKLVGEMEVLDNNDLYLCLSTNGSYSVRDALEHPDFNMKTDIFDKKLDNIPYFDKMYKYIVDNKLENAVVEFALFDKKLGINNENVIVYELRTHY